MSLQHGGYDGLAGARLADQHPDSECERCSGESARDAGAAGVEYEPRADRGDPPLASRIAQVVESDVAWGVIVLGVIVTAAMFAT